MALVAAEETYAKHPKSKQTFVLPFGKNQFYVPESAVVSFPKRSNKVDDGKALGHALATKAPEKWFTYTHPETLMQIRGNEGTSVYTTFEVPGQPDECRFLRLIGYGIAEKVFKEWRKEVDRQVREGELPAEADRYDRQRIRYEVLNWKKETDCPTRAQLHPELNLWTPVNKDGAELLKTCRIEPTSKARPKGTSDKRSSSDKRKLDDAPMIADVRTYDDSHLTKSWELTIPVTADNPPVLVKQGEFWELIQYKKPKFTTTNNEEEEDDDL
jgi:hypothetical protein